MVIQSRYVFQHLFRPFEIKLDLADMNVKFGKLVLSLLISRLNEIGDRINGEELTVARAATERSSLITTARWFD